VGVRVIAGDSGFGDWELQQRSGCGGNVVTIDFGAGSGKKVCELRNAELHFVGHENTHVFELFDPLFQLVFKLFARVCDFLVNASIFSMFGTDSG
jgi:hypothetical protein